MAEKKKTSLSQSAMWILMGLLIIGLAVGFGFDNGLAGSTNRLGRVGDKDVDINVYARALQSELQEVSRRAGRQVSFAEAQAAGIDQAVLQALLSERALDHETSQMGISVGDENVRRQVLQIPAFQSLEGSFDRDTYRSSLQHSGLSESEFENQLREQSARQILQGAVLGGVQMPDTYVDTLVDYVGETRNFTWARLDVSNLDGDLAEPTEEELRAFYEANPDLFQLPESKAITYAFLSPTALIDQVELTEEELREEYQARSSIFNQPERRLVERLVYLDEASAEAAAAQLDVGGTTFEALVEDRGLTLGDVDLGDVSRLELDAAGEAVFAAEAGDVVGPLPSSLGPALFRVNAILPAQSISFEEAEEDIRRAVGLGRARRLAETLGEEYNDLLAGGATLEQLADETQMELGQIDWYPALGEGISAYDGFRAAAEQVTQDDFPEVASLADGSIFALRLNDILPERTAPYDDTRETVVTNWEADRAERLLGEVAEAAIPQLRDGAEFAAVNLTATVEEDQARGAFIPGTPPAFIAAVFEMEPAEVRTVTGFGSVFVLRLDAVNPASDNADAQAVRAQLRDEMSNALARDLFAIFSADALLRAEPDVDPRALSAVHVSFP